MDKNGIRGNTKKPIVLAIQGASCSGKSTITKYLESVLGIMNVVFEIIRLDDYYLGLKEVPKNEYDYDNPGSLDWTSIHKVILAYAKGKKTILIKKYCYNSKLSKDTVIENTNPRFIIVEGLYGINPFLENTLNHDEFDPSDTNKNVEKEYIYNANYKTYMESFDIRKLLLVVSDEHILSLRKERDIKDGRAENEMEHSERYIKNCVLKAKKMWIEPVREKDNEITVINNEKFNDDNDKEINNFLNQLLALLADGFVERSYYLPPFEEYIRDQLKSNSKAVFL